MNQALDLFAEFAVDEKAAQEGVWRDYGDVSFLIAQSGNREYRKKFMKLYKPHERLLKTDTEAAEKKSDEIMAEVLSKTVLLDWKGKMIVEKGGQPVEYSQDNARKALLIPKFRDMVQEWADDFNEFKAVKDEADEKN